MQDCVKTGHYFLKAKVMSSYRVDISYDVTVTLSQLSGFVRDASCTCVALSMGRCSQVTALLFALANYLENASDISCTDVKCTWNRGRKKEKNPKKLQDISYPSSSKKKKSQAESPERIIDYDPRAPAEKEENPEVLSYNMLWSLGKFGQCNSMWTTLLSHKYDDFILDCDEKDLLKKQCDILNSNLKRSPTIINDKKFPVMLV